MNPRLRAMLLGVAMLGSGVAVYTINLTYRAVDLIDAGIRNDCAKRQARCTFFKPDAGYFEATTTVGACPNPDGGKMEIITTARAAAAVFDIDRCRLTATATNFDPDEIETPVSNSCACVQRDAGNCRYADGGRNLGRNEMQPGDWVGSDCVTRVCGELYGFNSRPTLCAP